MGIAALGIEGSGTEASIRTMYRAVMRTIAIRRQGTCLTQILIAFALIGALIFIVGIVSMATSDAG